MRGTGRSADAGFFVSELLSVQRIQGEMRRRGLQLGMCVSQPSSDDCVDQRALSWERPPCIVMSPTDGRPLDIAVESATAQLQIGRRSTPRHWFLNYTGRLKLRDPFEGYTPWWLMVARLVQVRRDGAFGGSRMAVR